ncbi:SLBB domain-containing protein [Botrimarina sp.]|uniref:polysaccharide biosynthesis/export family protein n=1 Tax=Botrimarina sp. TaxID=2795802 RepID=UPI0032ED4FAE
MIGRIDRGLSCVTLVTLACTGCSSLGLSLYPSGERLTTESKQVLEASRIPRGIPRENAKTVLPAHALQPGDVVLLEPLNVERDLRLPTDQAVLADGTLDLGAYGRIVVAGRTLEQAESLIEQQIALQLLRQRDACQRFNDDQPPAAAELGQLPQGCDGIAINVRLLEPVHKFYVLGEVNAPGSYPLTGSETVLDAIVSAGGLADNADPCEILLARPTDPCDCRVTLPVCYRAIVQMGNTTTNYQLQPGDRIFVGARSCLDEILFWRASHPCSRCAGCNVACRNPPISTARPMPVVESEMIEPGSSGRTDLADELILSSRAGGAGLPKPRGPAFGSADAPAEPVPATPPRETRQAAPAFDGELDFSPVVE